MRTLILSFLGIFLLSLAEAQAQSTVSLTVIIDSPQGNTIFDEGPFTNGSTVSVAIQATADLYITNVFLNPHSNLLNFQKVLIVGSLTSGFDPTTITNDSESFTLVSNSTLTVTFAPLSPVITEEPTNQAVVTGSSVTLAAPAVGRQPLSYQWLFNSNAIAGANTNSLILTNVQTSNTGIYEVVVTNGYGETDSISATLAVEDLVVLTNGQPVSGSSFTNLSQVTISLESRFTNGSIFYTLDGSAPDFGATPYSGPFVISATCTLRVIGYSADLSQSVMAGPFSVVILPTFTVENGTPGGGTITLNPSSLSYVSNTVVTVTANANPGFVFMGWSGALSGTNVANTVTVTSNMSIVAHFGTPLFTTVNGNGTISTFPAFPLYAYGTAVALTAIPNAGNYFGLWGDAASGNQNPLTFIITSPNPLVAADFGALPTNQVSLTLEWDGDGIALANPQTNKCQLGATNVITAYPYYNGGRFLGWGGDASGTTNPLSIVMNSSKTIIAHFSHSPTLELSVSSSLLQFQIYGFAGDTWQIQTSTGSLTNWVPFLTVTNLYNTRVSFTDTISSNAGIRVYRAVVVQ